MGHAHPQPVCRPAEVARKGSVRGWPGHLQHVERLVELRLGEAARREVAVLDDDLADRPALLDRSLDDGRRRLVADVAVEGRDDRRRALGELAGVIDVGADALDAPVGEEPARAREQPDRLEDALGEDGKHDVELEVAGGAGRRDRHVVADDLGAGHERRLGDDRVDLAGHDARARLEIGQVDLAEPGARAGGHPPQVVADLGQSDGDDLQRTRQLDDRVLGRLGLEVVLGLGEGDAGLAGHGGDDRGGEARRGVEPGACSGPAEGQLGRGAGRVRDPGGAELHLAPVAAELLAESDRHGVHEVGAARLHPDLALLTTPSSSSNSGVTSVPSSKTLSLSRFTTA